MFVQGLKKVLTAVEEVKTGLHHMQDELRAVKTVIAPSQPIQATENDATSAVASEDVEMRPATDQQDEDDEGAQRVPGAYSCAPTSASAPQAAEGEVNVHVARGRKVMFMLL